MRNNEVKKLIQGAMLSAIVGVVMLLNTLSSMTLISTIPYLLPIPFIIYTKQYGYKAGLVMLFVSSIISILVTPFHQVIILIAYGLIGIIYGQGAKVGVKDKFLIFYTFLGSLVFQIIMLFALAGLYGISVTEEINQLIKIFSDLLKNDLKTLATIKEMIRPLAIASYVTYSLSEAFVIHMVSEMLSKSLKIKTVEKIKFTDIGYTPLSGAIAATLSLVGIYFNKYPQSGIDADLMLLIAITGFTYLGFIGFIYFYSQDKLQKYRFYSTIILLLTLRFFIPIHIGIGLLTSLKNYWRTPHESTI